MRQLSKSIFQFKQFLILIILATSVTTLAYGQIRLPKLVSSGMVLQRNTKVRIWGWATSGEKVTVRFIGKTYTTTTGENGKWSVMMDSMKAGGPYSMEIDGINHIVLKNILVGDVWVCSGQSNMELPMSRIEPRYKYIMAHSQNSEIRQFLVPDRYNFKTPQKDVAYGSWVSANPWTIPDFSATAYFFARNLYKKYHVPVGLINASVGGTPVCSWMSKDALKKFPKLLQVASDYSHNSYLDSVRNVNAMNQNSWNKKIWGSDKGLNGNEKWYDANYNDSGWGTMKLPAFWTNEGLKNVNGVVWFRKEFNIPEYMTDIPATLWLGRIVDADYAYINGVFVGSVSYQYPPRIYNIAPDLLKPGKNNITIRVINYSGHGGFVKDKPYKITAGGKTINLKGNWKYKVGAVADKPLPEPTFIPYKPEGLFNGMISPLLNYTIKGAIWYQGESNTGDPGKPDQYHQEFTTMIKDWRSKWGEGNFPFLFVQLPNYGKPVTDPSAGSNWAKVREAQLLTLSLANTGMAITIDVGEWNDVHPLDKGDVGKRLALVAQKVAYGNKHIVYSGPIYKSMKIEGNKIYLTFTHTGDGLMMKGDDKLRDFAIAGRNDHFVWANAKIVDNDEVVVWSDEISHPEAVRYAWADNPGIVNLYNKEGLPASPFKTN